MINIQNLNFSYTQKQILHNINLNLKRGELVGIIGANGSGKTTLLKCIVGLYQSDNAILLDDRAIESYSYKERAKKIALMHQSEMINFDFSCFDVVSLGRFAYLGGFGLLSDEDKAIIGKKMATTKTTDFKKRAITRLSGGERQRVMFAKTLVQESPYILLDEPTNALDIKHQKEIFELSQQLCKQNCGVIMTIHNIRLAAKYCQRLILLSNGEVLADGSPQEVITSKNIKRAYQVDADVYYNKNSDQIDFVVK